MGCAATGARKNLKKFIIVILSVGILAGAYVIAFGVPAQVSQMSGSATEETAAASRGGPGGAGSPRGQGRATTVVLAPLEEQSYALVLRTIGGAA